jgi:hypothetical protein
MFVHFHDRWEPFDEAPKPLVTVLNFSGGKQSSLLLHMVLTGVMERPENFIVLNADPGMEDSRTYAYVEKMKRLCEEAGIYFETVEGPNLYDDLVNFKHMMSTRIDNPPFWIEHRNGTRGKLIQKCTHHYKIAPMDRAIRRILEERFGISKRSGRLGEGIVEKWLGFSFDEVHRIKPPSQKYIRFRYPLVDMKMTKEGVVNYFIDQAIEIPPRSVCVACFANSPDMYVEMRKMRPDDFRKAVKVDESIRDLSKMGVKLPAYVSSLLKPIESINEDDVSQDMSNDSCDSGYCFT